MQPLLRDLTVLSLVLGAAPLVARPTDPYANAPIREPVYLGAKACAECHDDVATGAQYSKWLTTAHARAYQAEPAHAIEQGRPTKRDRRDLVAWQRWSASSD